MTARESGDAGAFTLDSKLSSALGGRTAQAVQRAFGYATVGELLAHYPRRYASRGELTALAALPLDENVTIVAEVLEVRERTMRSRRGSILEAKISDGTGILTLTFFNQAWRARDLKPGVRGMFAGKVGDYKGARQLAHLEHLGDDRDVLVERQRGEGREFATRRVATRVMREQFSDGRVPERTLDRLRGAAAERARQPAVEGERARVAGLAGRHSSIVGSASVSAASSACT